MICEETAEYISALCDGETIPEAAAKHLGTCQACQVRLHEYLEIGVELRRVASLERPQEAAPTLRLSRTNVLANWWWKGWERMSMPRLAFASLLLVVAGLSSGLVIVGVKARTAGSVVMLKVEPIAGKAIACPLSTQDKKWSVCGGVTVVDSKILTYRVKYLSRDGDRVELGIRSLLAPMSSGGGRLSALDDVPEQRYWLEPDKDLRVDLPDLGPITVTGEWMDHVPMMAGLGNQDLDPGPGELRIASPLLVSGNKVLADHEGGIASVNKPGQGIQMYWPGLGLYKLSLSPLKGGTRGSVKLNRLSFQIDGQPYALVTGSPIARNGEVWVIHDANYHPMDPSAAFIGMVDLSDLTADDTGTR